jgi:hypothetical protein
LLTCAKVGQNRCILEPPTKVGFQNKKSGLLGLGPGQVS